MKNDILKIAENYVAHPEKAYSAIKDICERNHIIMSKYVPDKLGISVAAVYTWKTGGGISLDNAIKVAMLVAK